MGVDVELRIGRKNTLALIRADLTVVSLQRPQKVGTDAGGFVDGPPVSIPAQRFTIVPLSGLVWDRSDTTPDEGRLADVTEAMVGAWNADIQKDDWFPWSQNGIEGKYLITHVSNFRRWRTQALLRFLEE